MTPAVELVALGVVVAFAVAVVAAVVFEAGPEVAAVAAAVGGMNHFQWGCGYTKFLTSACYHQEIYPCLEPETHL